MLFKEKIIKFQTLVNTGYFRKVINKNLNIKLFNSILSSLLRNLFKFKSLFQFYWFLKSSINYKSFKQFWTVYIGYFTDRKYFSLIKLDRYLSNNPFCCSNLKNLPFEDESCQKINIKHFFKYFQNKDYNSIIKSWKKKLIPGGILQIQIKLENNEEKFEKLKLSLIKNEFFIKEINDFSLKIDKSINITAVKEKTLKENVNNIIDEKIEEILLIIRQNKNLFSNGENLCLLGQMANTINTVIKNLDLNIKNVRVFEHLNSIKNLPDDYFENAMIFNFFEYNNYSTNTKIFNELKRILKPGGNILAIVPEYKNYAMKQSAQFFNKGIFTRILDENNMVFNWINLSSTFRMIQVSIKNQQNFPLNKNGKKILLLGVYSLRYTFLNNARWDSQARAFEKLGYNILILDIKENSFSYLIKCIKLYEPDILWIAGKVAYSFLRKYADYFRLSNIKVVYWMWDLTSLNSFNFDGVIDYMFITSKGQIPLYKKKFSLENVYYIPASIMPEIIHRNKFIKEEFDIGFSGQLSYHHPWYKERTQILDFIKQHFSVKIFLEIYNNLPEYYSKCKIIFGGTPFFKNLELYTSNRPFIALSSGSCFITNYFRGLEKLAKNETHLLWYNNREELLNLLKKYIANNNLREKIRTNAEKLAREKHNYMVRIQNMLDIVDGKTENFYGFIN